jgi:hypothetical protein
VNASHNNVLSLWDDDDNLSNLTYLYHVTPCGDVIPVLKGKELPFINPADTKEQGGPGSGADRDSWQGCTWGVSDKCEVLKHVTLDPQGHLLGFTASGALVRVNLLRSVKPAHLQLDNISAGCRFSTLPGGSHRQAQSVVLACGQKTDVQLLCADGAVVHAHSAVLCARWDYFSTRERSIAAGNAVRGKKSLSVEVHEYSSTTIRQVLQHLYTGEVVLGPEASNTGGSSSTEAGGGGQKRTSLAARLSPRISWLWAVLVGLMQSVLQMVAKPFRGLMPRSAAGAAGPAPAVPGQLKAGSGSIGKDKSVRKHLESCGFSGQRLQLAELVHAAGALQLADLHKACLQSGVHELHPHTQQAFQMITAAYKAGMPQLERAVLLYAFESMPGGFHSFSSL